jgi:hypothetical protein
MMCNGRVQLRFIAIASALSCGLLFQQPVMAGPLFPGGNPHPNALPGTSGSVPLLDTNMGNLHYGDVEFAVFNAATWSVLFPLQDTPSGGVAAGEAVYAYQVFDNGAKPNGITQFSAGLSDILPFGDLTFDDELVTTGDSDYIAGTGQDPNLPLSPVGSSVPWKFLGASAINSEGSSVLFYTSPFGPTWDNGSTTTGAGASSIPAPEVGVPVPEGFIPEPSAFVLASLALCGLAIWRRR